MPEDEELAKEERCGELEAAGHYSESLAKARDPKLKAILKHNRADEITDHSVRLDKYIKKHEAEEKAEATA